MRFSMSIENFNKSKDYTIGLVLWWIIVSIFGSLYIITTSPWVNITYFTQLSVINYLNTVFFVFFPFIVVVFIISHIKKEE